MGVRGLNSFFTQNSDFSKPFKLCDMRVVIDGDNLLHALYFSNRINVIYGGDYYKYAESIKKFFISFFECNVKPILIFDGGMDKSGRKLKTIHERARTRLKNVKHIAQNLSYYERVIPILAYEVFISVLVELDIPFAKCDYEADDQITAIANHYECPVISADSDFYIYDVHKGFIRLDSIDMAVVSVADDEGKECKFLRCNMYHIDDFVSCFPGFNKCLFPLFATLMGNDYVDANEFNNFFSNIQLPKYKGRKLILNAKQKKMMGLLSWLKNTNLNEAIDRVLQYLKKDRREIVKSVIESAVKGYELHDCNLTRVLDQKFYHFDHMLSFDSGLVTPCGESLPMDLIIKYHNGQFSSLFVNVIVSHKIYLAPQIENISCPSSYDCSRPIRQIMYGILVRHSVGNRPCEDSRCISFIEEMDRQGTSLHKKMVEPIFSLDGIGKLPSINDLCSLKSEESKLILGKALGVERNFALNVPNEWQLLFGCIEYWLQNCEPVTTQAFLYALIVNLIYFAVITQNTFLENFASTPMTDDSMGSSVFSILSKISQNELQNVKKNLKKYLVKPTVNQASPLLLYILHSYSQLQGVIWSILDLNKLLNGCLKNPSPQRCFSGTMLYNLAKDISTRSDPELFVAELLGRESGLCRLFSALKSIILQDVPCERIQKHECCSQKGKKKNTKHSNPAPKIDCNVFNKFDILNVLEAL